MARPQRYAISYGSLRRFMSVLGMGPRFSGAELSDERLTVHMGWAFGRRSPWRPSRVPPGGSGQS